MTDRGDAVHLRLAEPRDAPGVLDIYAPLVSDTIVSFEEQVPSLAEMTRRIENTLERWPWIVAEEQGELAGYAYATAFRARHAYRWSCEVSVYVGKTWRRQRLGARLYENLFSRLRQQGYRMAYAGIALPNPASVALHERLGFAPIGVFPAAGRKHGAWIDVGWWSLGLDVLGSTPEEPIPLQELGRSF